MSRERVIKALSNLGLEVNDIEVYVFLAREGPHEAHTLAEALRLNEQDLFASLELLRNKGMIKVISEITPKEFFAVSFEKALDLLLEVNLIQAQLAEKNKKAILEYWYSMLKMA